jgi:predicted nucleic-acid-binding protein
VNVTPDTNILVRMIVHDNPYQTVAAEKLLSEATIVTLSISSLCELVWVLRTGYKLSHKRILVALQALSNAHNVVVDRHALQTGMDFVQAQGDFADGVIAFEGRALGSDTFVSFDKQAVALLKQQGHPAHLLS